jgi:hypothetical protein
MAEKTASLTVLGGPLAGQRCVLPESGTVTIGSAAGSLMQLDLPTVSPFHARIQVEAGRVTVHDTGAERKVHVNDNPLEPGGTVLRNGDILWLGTPGEDDVVMLQCILPRRPAEAPSPAPPVPATPTPEVETLALRAARPEPSSPPAPPVTAEPEEPARSEETLAIQPEGVVADETAAAPPGDEALVVAEPSLPGATEEEMVAAVEVAAEPGDFIEEAEAVVVEEGEVVAEPGPTTPTPPRDELAEPQPVAIDFGDTVAFAPEPVAPPAPPRAEPELPPTVASAPPPLPAAPASPPAAPAAPPTVAKPPAVPPTPPAARPVAPARPAPSRPAPRPGHPSASTPRRDLRHPAATPRPAAAPVEAEPGIVEAPATPSAGKWRSPLLALAGFAAVLVIAGLGWVAWRFLAARPSPPASTPAPVAQASIPPATRPPAAPTPEATASIPVPTPSPPVATPRPGSTPTPAPTPTPRATPTPPARPTPTPPPAATGPSAEAVRAQQAAAQAQALLAQAEAAIGARQYDAAVSHLDSALGLEPGNTRAASLRADAVRRRDLARRRFAPGRTVVESPKAQKEGAGDLAGFDTGDADVRKAPDFLGRIDFEMSPASGVEPGDTWTLRVYVANDGKKPIRVQGVTVTTAVNGSGGGGPVPPRTREIAPQQRSLVAEATGAWREGTTSWTTEVTVDGGKGESLRNTLTWR